MSLPGRGDYLVRGEWVLTAGPRGVLRDAAVHIVDGQIRAVGAWTELRVAHPEANVVGDGTGIVAPGFVNTHTHLSEALATGMGSELRLAQWGEHIVGPLGEVLTIEDAREGTALRSIEMLLSGVTTVNDMFVHGNPHEHASVGVVAGLEASGLRGVVSFGAEDLPGGPGTPPWASVDRILEEQYALEAAALASELVSFRYGVGTLLGQSDALLEAGTAECHARDWAVHTHLHETREELTSSVERWGRRTAEHADDLGMLGRPLIAGHAVWVTDADIALLAARGTAVAHNPIANMILGSGVAPILALLAAGIPVGIGTDGAASNDSQNMLEAVKMAALLQKVHSIDPSVIDASTVFEMATMGGARALGLDSVIGSLEPGKAADVVLYQGSVEVSVIHDPIGQLVYGASPRAVSDVFVDGRRLVADHRCVSVDESAQLERVRALVEHIARDSTLGRDGWSLR
ncbi:MAG: amidohydrolase [Rhodoglobus sp.]